MFLMAKTFSNRFPIDRQPHVYFITMNNHLKMDLNTKLREYFGYVPNFHVLTMDEVTRDTILNATMIFIDEADYYIEKTPFGYKEADNGNFYYG